MDPTLTAGVLIGMALVIMLVALVGIFSNRE
jgi:hypothetical protein